MTLSTLVLTAGLGTRLDPLTRLVAKPAVPVAGEALGERVLRWLAREGVTDTVLNLHHLPHTITGLIGDGAAYGLTVRYSWEREILGSAGGPRHALALMNSDPFLIVNGDTLTDVALAPIVEAHAQSGADVTMVVIPNPAPDRYNGVIADADGTVRAFIPKGHTVPSWHFVGIQIVNRRVFAALPDNTPAETVREVYRALVETAPGRVRVHPVAAAFHDVGTPQEYVDTCRAFGGVDDNGNVIWPGARIDPGAHVTNSIAAGAVTIPPGVVADHAILAPASIATDGDNGAIVGEIAVFKIQGSQP
ncbi:MAG: sugar phosphate nucleotidyltransferase [Acidobacteriota bacterium]